MVKDFLNHGHLIKEHNQTQITLIPEKDSPKKVSDYRPIRCNICCKFMSKVMANRLRKVLPKLIFPLQNAFLQIGILMTISALFMRFFLSLIKNKENRLYND